MSIIGDLLPAGVLNVVNGFGVEAGKPLASSNRIAKIAFTGETTTGRLIMQYAVAEPDPGHAGTRRQEPQHLLQRRAGRQRQTTRTRRSRASPCSPSTRARSAPARRASLIQADIYDEFLALAAIRTKAVRQGDPLDTETMIGAQASNDQLEKILSYIEIGKSEGAQVLTGGERADSAATSTAATTSRRRSSPATTRCGCSRRRSSARSWR